MLTTRYVARAHRLLRDATARFEVMHVPPLASPDVTDLLAPAFNGYEQMPTDDRDYLGRAVQALTDGRAGVRARDRRHDGADGPQRRSDQRAHGAARRPEGALDHWCRFCYELRLHRARGYGALKAILDILADEEPLTLTEISHAPAPHAGLDEGLPVVARGRRPRDVATEALQLHRPAAPAVGAPALPARAARRRRRRARGAALRARPRARSPNPTPALAYAGVEASPDERKSWGIIEID